MLRLKLFVVDELGNQSIIFKLHYVKIETHKVPF